MTQQQIAETLQRRAGLTIDAGVSAALATYLELLVCWNARTNLTAVREPEEIVVRHFGECIQCARALPPSARTLLDFGSGAGFPGAICSLLRPEIATTLAESQGKKAAFLSELVRRLGLSATVHAARAEALAASRVYDVVTLRAVDCIAEACRTARARLAIGGRLCLMTTEEALARLKTELADMEWGEPRSLSGSEQRIVVFASEPA